MNIGMERKGIKRNSLVLAWGIGKAIRGVDKVDEIYQNRKVSSHGRRQHSNGEITQMLELTDKDFNAATIKC